MAWNVKPEKEMLSHHKAGKCRNKTRQVSQATCSDLVNNTSAPASTTASKRCGRYSSTYDFAIDVHARYIRRLIVEDGIVSESRTDIRQKEGKFLWTCRTSTQG
jgi:hypothetical protein